jgi:hypothetical protein
VLLAAPGPAQAFGDGPCSYGYGCGGLCLNLFSRIHQHGPLYNYGPYYGYPPFEPYGPWDAYLRYHDQGSAGYAGHAKFNHGNLHPLCPGGLGSLLHHGSKHGGCGTGGTGGCATCGSGQVAPAAQTPTPTAYGPYQVNPYAGYAGYGYGYNPYAAASGAYYGPYMTQPMPYQPGVVPAGMPYR